MKKKTEILCSTGTLVARINGRDARMITKYCSMIDCDGFEFLMEPEFYDDAQAIARLLNDSDVVFKMFHIDKDIGWFLSRLDEGDERLAFDRLAENFKMADRLGVYSCVLHLWGGIQSDSELERNIGFLPRILKEAQSYGMEINVENVPCTTHTPYENVKLLTSLFPNVRLTFDSRFAAFHSQEDIFSSDEELWVNNIRHVHISDISEQSVKERSLRPILHPHEGCCRLDVIYERIRKSHMGYVTVESPVFLPDHGADTDKMNETIKRLRKELNG